MVFSPQLAIENDNFETYIHQVERTLQSFNLNFCNCNSSTLAKLKQTLTQIEVTQIKHTAISEGIWDFYPTTKPVIQKMLSLAQLQPNHYVLEPSAGAGDLANEIAQTGVSSIDCFEPHPLLQKSLRLQDFNLIGGDFLASIPQPVYDRVIANPPFGTNGVANHTTHAFKFLKPGGRLVTLAHHYQLKPSQTDKQFFNWLKQHKARFLNLGSAFKNSDHKTNVPLQTIVINKL